MPSLQGIDTTHMHSLKELTTWRIGGCGTQLFFPTTEEEIRSIILETKVQDHDLAVIGYGSNILINDEGFDGVVLVLKKNFAQYELKEKRLLVVESGLACPKLARMTGALGFNNLTFLAGIPGSVGGAVKMNAGAHHQAIMEHVFKVELMDMNGVVHHFERNDVEADYRKTLFPIKGIIIRVWLLLKPEGSLTVTQVMEYRAKTQPLASWSCGSVFKNPFVNISAGWLIEQVGLKGFCFHDLEISSKHANFIINKGRATAQDVQRLTLLIQKRVYILTGYWLHPEYQNLTACF
jgi:UDP-N-acetylmuramate dehydrogenase